MADLTPTGSNVRGFIEHGTTTPFDMTVRNKVSRYHLVADAIHNARRTPVRVGGFADVVPRQARRARRLRGRASGGYARREGLDAPRRSLSSQMLVWAPALA
jgi:phosphoketolase